MKGLRGLDVMVSALGAPVAGVGTYLGVLTLFSRGMVTPVPNYTRHFAIVVPAHNEATGIVDTIASLRRLDYPVDKFDIVVIADNCTDSTAELARATGVTVIERFDDARRSKGFALADVFPKVLQDPRVDAVVVIDADTQVDANLLSAFSARFVAGAHAAQADYQVANPDGGWRTELMTVAFTCFHEVRSMGRERLGLSTGLRGNGMAFTRFAMETVPHVASSLVEDLEHGIALAKAGIRVAYVHEAHVRAEMPVEDDAAASQRKRWEHGRDLMRAEHGWPLVKLAAKNRSKVQADLAADVLIPPLTQVVKANVLLGGAAFVITLGRKRFGLSTAMAALALGGLGAHVGSGWRRSGVGVSVLAKLPGYLRWKSGLTFGSSGADNAWVRTRRIGEDVSSNETSSETSHPSPADAHEPALQAPLQPALQPSLQHGATSNSTRSNNEVRP
jgi:1,2-diacylglycerol 3-beta-glucosyltransferase